jgi:drug/metabolite transporter (DMT)-like permease
LASSGGLPYFFIKLSVQELSPVGLGLGFVGVAALLGFGTISGPLGWAGVGCMLIATLGYAIGPLIIQRHLSGLDRA